MGSAVDEFYGRSETSGSRHSLSQLYLSLADTWVIYDNSRAGSPLLIKVVIVPPEEIVIPPEPLNPDD